MKRTIMTALSIALLLAVGLAGIWLWNQGAVPAEAQAGETTSEYSPAETITVVGQGSVRVRPDIARVSIGVETSAEMVGDAVAENEDKMAALLAALAEAGIAEEDIQTMHYSINLDRYPEPMPRSTGEEGAAQPVYRVSNMVNVTIRDLGKVGQVLDAVIEAGANNIWGVSFGLDDPESARADARTEAIEDALDRAGALAELSGVELGPVMSVSEVVGSGVSPVAVDMVERAAGGGSSVSPGELEIGYQVQVTYFLER